MNYYMPHSYMTTTHYPTIRHAMIRTHMVWYTIQDMTSFNTQYVTYNIHHTLSNMTYAGHCTAQHYTVHCNTIHHDPSWNHVICNHLYAVMRRGYRSWRASLGAARARGGSLYASVRSIDYVISCDVMWCLANTSPSERNTWTFDLLNHNAVVLSLLMLRNVCKHCDRLQGFRHFLDVRGCLWATGDNSTLIYFQRFVDHSMSCVAVQCILLANHL